MVSWNLNTTLRRWLDIPIIIWEYDWMVREMEPSPRVVLVHSLLNFPNAFNFDGVAAEAIKNQWTYIVTRTLVRLDMASNPNNRKSTIMCMYVDRTYYIYYIYIYLCSNGIQNCIQFPKHEQHYLWNHQLSKRSLYDATMWLWIWHVNIPNSNYCDPRNPLKGKNPEFIILGKLL